jgi:diguanylate cyclase (GGDEF)-like protein
VDLVARYGGEEFACILPDTDLRSSVQLAKKIKRAIEELKIEHADSPVAPYVTASFGIITVNYSPELALEDIMHMADRLLYKAKAGGRNRMEFAEWAGSDKLAR